MSALSLKISVVERDLVKTMQFDPSTQVFDAIRMIREKLAETNIGQGKDYGLFLTDEDPKKGVWLEPGRSLEYYLLRNGDVLAYRRKMRTLKIRMLDGTVKTVLVDDSQPVANLMVAICTKIGITNHDEYSLVRELVEEGKEGAGGAGSYPSGTLTLGRRNKDKEKTMDAKMEQLKKKLKTDDDLDWVDHSKTLREQGIDEDETLLLRRKFFFSDQNIDSRDPIQLNLLYVQARDAIVAGTHPVTLDQACGFGGLQAQIQFGDHVESKHKTGFLDLREFLPKDFARQKNVEKKLFGEHRKHSGLSQLDAKVKYVQLARSLPTYGVTFFLVKEKMKGKNKLAPRLLGVTKDSVLRLDEKTKEILKTWPLTTVKRWAASPNSFTLDFGDYSDSYYSVQTTEGEQISQLIGGYIDIILRRQKAKDHFGIEGDEGSTMIEESVAPYKATILQHQTPQKPIPTELGCIAMPVVLRAPDDGQKEIITGQMPVTQQTHVKGHAHVGHIPESPVMLPGVFTPDLTEPQRALISTIDDGQAAIKKAEKELMKRVEVPELTQDQLDSKKEQVSSRVREMKAATAELVDLTNKPLEKIDTPAVERAVASITRNLPQMSKDVKLIAALMEDDDRGDQLIDATRKLCSAFSDLLKAAEPKPGKKVPKEELLNAAAKVSEATTNLLSGISDLEEERLSRSQRALKSTIDEGQGIIKRAKDDLQKKEHIIEKSVQWKEDQLDTKKQKVTSQVREMNAATVEVVHLTGEPIDKIDHPAVERAVSTITATLPTMSRDVKVVAALMEDEDRGERLLDATRKMCSAFSELLKAAEPGARVPRQELLQAASKVGEATTNLLAGISDGEEDREVEYDRETGDILLSIAKGVANAAAALVRKAKDVASKCEDSATQNRVINTATQCALATSQLVATAKVVAPTIQHPVCQKQLTRASSYVAKSVERIVEICQEAVYDERLLQDLRDAASAVTRALNDLLSHVRSIYDYKEKRRAEDRAQYSIQEAQDRMFEREYHRETEVSNRLTSSARIVGEDYKHDERDISSAARAVTQSVNNVINMVASGAGAAPPPIPTPPTIPIPPPPAPAPAPGQKECDAAIRDIQSMRGLLDSICEPIHNLSYFESLDAVMEKSRKLGDAMTNIGKTAKGEQHEAFGRSVQEASHSICGLIEYSAHTSYLVVTADTSSIPGRPGLVNLSAFNQADEAIQAACKQLVSRGSNQQQILSAATVIAKHTSALCNACRAASARTANPAAKRHFVQSAKDVANATANLVKEIKALDQEPASERNRQQCEAATRPLIQAVENLTAFAGSPEFAPIPAQISEKARFAQEPITSSGKQLIDFSCGMLLAAKSLALNPKDPPGWQTLANHSKNVSDTIKKLVISIKDAAPGSKEVERAIEMLGQNIRELDQASLNVISQNLHAKKGSSVKGYREAMVGTVGEIIDRIPVLKQAGKIEAEKIGHAVFGISSYFDPLVQNAIGCAAKTSSSKAQMALLDQTKTVCECALQLMHSVKECGGNPKATSHHADIDIGCDSFLDSLSDLARTLETASSKEGEVTPFLQSLAKSMNKLDEKYSFTTVVDGDGSFVDYQTRMVKVAKEIVRISQDMVGKSTTQPEHLVQLSSNLAHQYSLVAADALPCVAATSNPEIADRIKNSVHELGTSCTDLTKGAGACQANPGDPYYQREIAEQARTVSEKVSFLLAALQAGSRGTQACINAASTVSGIIGDLDTTIMFATAGTLNSENENETFSEHRENILKTAKALVEDTKTLVAGAASSQEQLAVAAQNAVTTIVQLSEVVKMGAASLGYSNSEAQVMLINAVKDVAASLSDLILSTKDASGKNVNDPAMARLKESAKVMVTNVTSLLKTVKTVEDEHERGTRALEATIEAIGQEVRAFDSGVPVRKATPEDLIKITKPVTLATAKAVAAGTSGKQEDIIVAANMGRKAIFDLLVTGKQAAWAAETPDLKRRVMDATRTTTNNYRRLLEMVHQIVQRSHGAANHEERQQLIEMSRTIATAVTELVTCSELLKGSDWVDPDDPTVIAETELLGAASSIEAAARKLASLQPRRTSIKLPHEDMNFDEMILEAAKAITAATSALVKAASAAQRELVSTGRIDSQPAITSDDGQWSEGLISAARHVAAATHSLVEAANALVQGQACEEKLISAANQVASSTACLLVACKVKADPDSKTMRRLQEAGKAVKKATDNLVRAAQQAIEQEDEQSLVISRRRVSGIAQEISAREVILKKERELDEAREKLMAIRRAKYHQKQATNGTEIRQYEYQTYTQSAS